MLWKKIYRLEEMFDLDQWINMLTKAVSNLGMKEGPKHCKTLNIRGIAVTSEGQGNPSWHVALMGYSIQQ